MSSPTVVSKELITRIRRELSEIETRATGDELRSAFNKSVPRAEREQLHGFVRGDSAVLVDCGNMLLEMERLKDNETIFLVWLDSVLDRYSDLVKLTAEINQEHIVEESSVVSDVREVLAKYRADLLQRDQEISGIATEPRLA